MPIRTVVWPTDCEIVDQSEYYAEFQKTHAYENIAKDLKILYQTIDEYKPTIFYQKSNRFPGKVALSLQYLPSLGDPTKPE